ncbi:MAG: inverse autotransporter beta domain-containing protein, partial [Pirellulales bacterium]|nr:inverse autotransporter beta domain-containing protein [Pirellulales bacterium]
MKTPRLIICHALLLAMLPLGSAAFGQYEQPYMPYEDMGNCESCDSGYCGDCAGHGKGHRKGLWPSLPFGIPDSHIWVGYTYGNRESSGIAEPGQQRSSIPSPTASVSFDGGYSTVGGFFPHYTQFPNGNWFLQAHWHYTDQDQNMANIGLGRRFMLDERMYGMSFWYDFDEAGDDNLTVGKPFHQIGLNFETRGPWFDMFINWYQPVGDRSYFTGSIDGGSAFFEHNILIQSGLDLAMEGMDAEVQMAVPFMEFLDPHASFGGYAYQDQTNERQLNGYFGRFTFNPTPRTSFNVRINHDDTNNTTVAAQFAFGFGSSRRYACGSQLLDLPVRRLDHIVRFKQDQVLATNPATGEAWQVQHVDNTALPGGDGSFENPYNELDLINGAGSEENDLIFVAVGTGTDLNYDAEVVLKDGQLLLGQGTEHFIDTVEVGNFELPGFISGPDGERLAPMITATGGSAVTLANDNRVSGFDIDGANFGIVGDGITDVEINNILFGANTSINNDAINITDLSGVAVIEENEITNAGNGIVLGDNGAGTTLNATIAANLVDGVSGDAVTLTVNDGDVWNVAINGNDLINNDNGLVANINGIGELNVTSTGNNYGENSDAGVRINLDGTSGGLQSTVNFTGDLIDANGQFGVDLQLAAANNATLDVNFDGGQVNDTGVTTQTGIGINAEVLGGLLNFEADSLDVIGTDATNAAVAADRQGAVNLAVNNDATINASIINGSNINTTEGVSGVYFDSQGTSTDNSLAIQDSNINGNVVGLSVQTGGSTITSVSVNGGQINNNTQRAVDITAGSSDTTNVTITGTSITGNGAGGLFLDANGT